MVSQALKGNEVVALENIARGGRDSHVIGSNLPKLLARRCSETGGFD